MQATQGGKHCDPLCPEHGDPRDTNIELEAHTYVEAEPDHYCQFGPDECFAPAIFCDLDGPDDASFFCEEHDPRKVQS